MENCPVLEMEIVPVMFLLMVLQIQVLPEGGETPMFKQFFLDWKERDQSEGFGKVFTTEKVAKIQQVEFDASKLHESHHMAAQYNMVDDGSGETQVNELYRMSVYVLSHRGRGNLDFLKFLEEKKERKSDPYL